MPPADKSAPARTTSPFLAALAADERATVLERLLHVHPEVVAEAEQLAGALLQSASIDATAGDLSLELELLDLADLAARAGRQLGRGYVHEVEAASELVEETVRPFIADVRRRAELGLLDAARVVAIGAIAGLYRSLPPPEGSVRAYAGEDSASETADWVRHEAAEVGVEITDDDLTAICPRWL